MSTKKKKSKSTMRVKGERGFAIEKMDFTPEPRQLQATDFANGPLADLYVNVFVPSPRPCYSIVVTVRGRPGFFTYNVDTRDQAMTHFGEITTKGYRRENDRGQLEWFAPSMIDSVKIVGDDLSGGVYADRFVRT